MASNTNRLYFLDNLKWFLIVLVISHHIACAFAVAGGTDYKVPIHSAIFSNEILGSYLGMQQSFFMSLFFAISAFFLIPSIERKGTKLFIFERFQRLGIPLLITFFIIEPLATYWSFYLYHGSLPPFFGYTSQLILKNMPIVLFNAGLGVAWFIKALLLFTMIAIIYLTVNKPKSKQKTVYKFPSHLKIFSLLIILMIINYVVVNFLPAKITHLTYLFSVTGKDDITLYVASFILGIMAWHEKWHVTITMKIAWPWFLLAVLVVFLEVIKNLNFFQSLSSLDLYNTLKPIICFGFSLFLLALFKKYFNRETSLSRVLSQSAYTAYIFQIFFVIGATVIVQRLPFNPVIHFLIAAPFAVVTTFIASHYIRLIPLLRKVL